MSVAILPLVGFIILGSVFGEPGLSHAAKADTGAFKIAASDDLSFACRIDGTANENGSVLSLTAIGIGTKDAVGSTLRYALSVAKTSPSGTVRSKQAGEVTIEKAGEVSLATLAVGLEPDLAISATLELRDAADKVAECQWDVPGNAKSNQTDGAG